MRHNASVSSALIYRQKEDFSASFFLKHCFGRRFFLSCKKEKRNIFLELKLLSVCCLVCAPTPHPCKQRAKYALIGEICARLSSEIQLR